MKPKELIETYDRGSPEDFQALHGRHKTKMYMCGAGFALSVGGVVLADNLFETTACVGAVLVTGWNFSVNRLTAGVFSENPSEQALDYLASLGRRVELEEELKEERAKTKAYNEHIKHKRSQE